MNASKDLSIVVLCYRSEETIISFLKRVTELASRLTDSFEVILVANYLVGAQDRTREIVEALAAKDERLVPICLPKEGMMGWDMRMGMEKASGDYICVIDGDGQFPLESIERCFAEIKTGKYDLVKTYRVKRHDGFNRLVLSKVYNMIFSVLFPGLRSRDINSKPKILTRAAYERLKLKSDDWFVDAEIMINVRRERMTFLEFPVNFEKLKWRTTFVRLPAVLEFIKNLSLYRLKEYRRNRPFG